jgi:hypothetical protein
MKRQYLLSLLIAVLLLPFSAQAQLAAEEEIVVKSDDGNILITSMSLKLRDYVFVPVKWDAGIIYLEDEFAGATAVLDLRESNCFCLSVEEPGLHMKLNCKWCDIRIPDHEDIWVRLTENDRAFFSRTAIQRSLIAGMPGRNEK